MKVKLAKLISILTVVPIIAFFLITLLYYNFHLEFRNSSWYVYSLFFLTILPIMAYPLKRIIPVFKNQGRDGERKLAFILAVIGYVCGSIFAVILKAPMIVQKIFAAYLYSGVILYVINKFIHFKASGHACGVSGPITLLYSILGTKALWFYLILPLVFWARMTLKRHKMKELIAGTLVGIFSTIIALKINVFM